MQGEALHFLKRSHKYQPNPSPGGGGVNLALTSILRFAAPASSEIQGKALNFRTNQAKLQLF